MFADQAVITVKAGNGGAGCVSFRRERFVPRGGPDGGDGGDGGDVWICTDPNTPSLEEEVRRKFYRASSGQPGQGKNKTGAKGEDLTIKVPIGTVVNDGHTVFHDLSKARIGIRVARGGRGGFGNRHFTTATNQAPREAQAGETGEEKVLKLTLKLIADVGLVGLPNAGKSTLLSKITQARPKIGAYPFTTTRPVLGVVTKNNNTLTIADIPGIIEGAASGKGLGLQFLRHIERTRVIVYLLDASSNPERDLKTLQKELGQYSKRLAAKPYLLVLSKADLIKAAPVGMKFDYLVSARTGVGITELIGGMFQRLNV